MSIQQVSLESAPLASPHGPAETVRLLPPKHTYELELYVGGCDWDTVARRLLEEALHVASHGPKCTSAWGGAGTSGHVEIRHYPDVTEESYNAALAEWFAAKKAARSLEPSLGTNGAEAPRDLVPESQGGEPSDSPDGRLRAALTRVEALEWAIVRTLYAGDIDPPNPTAPFWFREQLLTDAGLTMERCRELMDVHRGEDRVARL